MWRLFITLLTKLVKYSPQQPEMRQVGFYLSNVTLNIGTIFELKYAVGFLFQVFNLYVLNCYIPLLININPLMYLSKE